VMVATAAVRQNGMALQFVPVDSFAPLQYREIADIATAQNHDALQFIGNPRERMRIIPALLAALLGGVSISDSDSPEEKNGEGEGGEGANSEESGRDSPCSSNSSDEDVVSVNPVNRAEEVKEASTANTPSKFVYK
jgi:hypothetical protein